MAENLEDLKDALALRQRIDECIEQLPSDGWGNDVVLKALINYAIRATDVIYRHEDTARAGLADSERLTKLEAQIDTDVGVNLHSRGPAGAGGVGLFCMAADTQGDSLRSAIDKLPNGRALANTQRISSENA